MEHKRLYRSTNNKMIAGVCGGIAEYFKVDPVIIRILFVLLLLPGGFPGLIPYLVLWAIIPEEGSDTNSSNSHTPPTPPTPPAA